jgi:hypothetical protein
MNHDSKFLKNLPLHTSASEALSSFKNILVQNQKNGTVSVIFIRYVFNSLHFMVKIREHNLQKPQFEIENTTIILRHYLIQGLDQLQKIESA